MNASLGTKRQCPECSAKFFDLNAVSVACPKCGFGFPKAHKPSRHVAELKAAQKVVAKKPVRPSVIEDDYEDDFEDMEGMDEVIELEELDDFDDDLEHLEEVEDHQESSDVDMNSDDAEDGMFIDELPQNDLKLVDSLEDEEEENQPREAAV